ncbi:MAG: pyruvate kinase [bacterium]
MKKEIWCTLGPSSLNDRVIGRLEEAGVSLFRLNLSHTKTEDVAQILKYIQSRTSVPICLDTEGAQIRTGEFAVGKVTVRENRSFRISRYEMAGDEKFFHLNPVEIVQKLRVGDLLKIDAEVLAQVIAVDEEGAVLWVLNGGEIGQNKAITILEREIEMSALSEKDEKALAIGKKMGIRHVALSFANRAQDVEEIRAAAHPQATVISKIECLNGLQNLAEIAEKSDALLIDRGDLSRQVNIEKIPAMQKDIIRYGKVAGVNVYVATNLMESMVTSPNPTRAEVNDVYNTLMDGADGLVLAAETAIGDFPVSAASMVKKIIGEFENNHRWQRMHYTSAPISLLIEPHGGELVNREVQYDERQKLQNLKTLKVKYTDLLDCVQIANGTYSPLMGFMNKAEMDSVLENHRLPNGLAWTMPIVLQTEKSRINSMVVGERIALTDDSGKIYATLKISEIFTVDFAGVAKKWFGTSSRKHPGVARLFEGGDRFLAGEIILMEKMASPYQHYELTPAQTRMIFTQKGWSKVVGFHTRNVPHKAHEYIQINALDLVHADGLYISPVIGPKKSGDFLAEPILKSYKLLLDECVYPPGKVVLGAFSTYSRYCGPREAVFTALCRKNMGCSHFVVGRDHTGVDSYYNDADTRRLFEKLHDIEIVPIFFDQVGYDPQTKTYGEKKTPSTLPISGGRIRQALQKNERLPAWLIRESVQDLLRTEISQNRPVFYD